MSTHARRSWRTGLLLVISAAGALACADAKGAAIAADPGASPGASGARSVRTALAEEQTWERTLQVTGELEAFEEATLSALVPGRLELLVVDLGSRVEAGDAIAAVELRDYELGVAQAEAAWRAARARLALEEGQEEVDPERVAVVREARSELADAARQLERQRSLSDDNIVAASALDAAQARHSIAESRLAAAFEDVAGRRALLEQRRVELDLARAALADAAIVAPFDGAVAERLADRGDYLSVGAPVVRLVRFDPLRLRLAIPERRAHEVRAGQQARIELEGLEGPILATVDRLSPELDAANRTLTIELEVANPDGALRPGSFARASLVVDPQARTLVVPRAAVVRFAGIDKVFVVEEGRAVERRDHRRPQRRSSASRSSTAWRPAPRSCSPPAACASGAECASRAEAPSGDEMQRLVDIFIRRPVFASMLIATLVVVGLASFLRSASTASPRSTCPRSACARRCPARPTEEVETLVAQRIEEAVNTVEGIDELRSISGNGIVARDADLRPRARHRRRRAGRARPRGDACCATCRPETDPPIVSKFDNDQSPVLTLRALRRALAARADRARRQDRQAAARALDGRRRGAHRRRRRARDQRLDRRRPAARLRAPDHAVRDAMRAPERRGARRQRHRTSAASACCARWAASTDPAAFDDLVVASVDGTPVRVRDVGRAEDGTKEQRSLARLDGVPSVTLEVRRQSGANTVEVIDGVQGEARARCAPSCPPTCASRSSATSRATSTRRCTRSRLHLVLGSILACLVVLAFMRSWRSTLIAAVAIPCSVDRHLRRSWGRSASR